MLLRKIGGQRASTMTKFPRDVGVRAASSATTGFFQDPPVLGNQFDDDEALVSLIRRLVPSATRNAMNLDAELHRFGARVVAPDILEACHDAEYNPPRHIPIDAWGRRVDKLLMTQGWTFMKKVAAEEGLIALAYDPTHGEYARVQQFAKLYLFSPSSAVFTCPLAMADGAARLIEQQPQKSANLRHAFDRLVSRDPALAWTSGQWMTERTGGSDVSKTETVATPHPTLPSAHLLHGFKWFSSATDSEMTLLLARLGADNPRLSLFFGHVHTAADKQTLNGIRIQRLKPKYGTHALPTAELELDGMVGELVGEPGRGVATIATVLNITRIHTAVNAVSFFRRALATADAFATKRVAFGKTLIDHPLHKKTLWDLHVDYRRVLHLVFTAVAMLGRVEAASRAASGSHEDDEHLLRLLTPVVKAWCSKVSLAAISECCEAMGGAGYIEDVGLGRLLRDCQAQTIWEGTTNVLSLDVRKLCLKDTSYTTAWSAFVDRQLRDVPASNRCKTAVAMRAAALVARMGAGSVEAEARDILFDLGETTSAALLLAHAQATGNAKDWEVAQRVCCGDVPADILGRPRL
ncbi:Aste57867_15210 [Aphanomyces stellatus]|uniref:Aste57867_15210 protein n=1 Tax=Aphanomyces stellatus TaxID=120398 RepID=A0A485L373_9STRA|nr:hypothetical protein As57867_015154 [Aphanomyces stellatus]VFT92019.1 Aste57867_15210 [Aphanomyces stellatus]